MTEPVRTDALSLTLPKARGRASERRRLRPDPWFWFYLAFTVIYVVIAVWAFLISRPVLGGADALVAGLYWRITLAVKSAGFIGARPFLPLQLAAVPLLFVVGGFLS